MTNFDYFQSLKQLKKNNFAWLCLYVLFVGGMQFDVLFRFFFLLYVMSMMDDVAWIRDTPRSATHIMVIITV